MKRLLLISMVLVLAAQVAPAQDSLGVADRTFLRLKPLAGAQQTLLYKGTPSYTEASAGYRLRSEDDAFVPQEGRGLGVFFFQADAAHRLDARSAVEGGAGYERGVKRGVRMNTSSDWDLLYPYHTADTVGGDLQKEQYSFHGAYYHSFGSVFLGGGIRFRALHEFRAQDPRPRNIVSDLQGKISVGTESGPSVFSLDLLAGKYHQSQDIEFLDPRGHNTSILHMAGLGQHYGRFAGSASSMDARFRGLEAGAVLRMEPRQGTGWFSSLGYDAHRYVRHIKNQNEAPLSRLWVQEVRLEGGFKAADALYKGSVVYESRRGKEAVLDVKGAYLSLLDLPLYDQNSLKASLSALRSWEGAEAVWTLCPEAGFSYLQSTGLNPERSLSLSAAEVSLGGNRLSRKGDWVYRLQAGLDGRFMLGKTLSLPEGKTDKTLYDHYLSMTDRWGAHAGRLTLGAFIQRELSERVSLFGNGEAGGTLYSDGHYALAAALRIGFIF